MAPAIVAQTARPRPVPKPHTPTQASITCFVHPHETAIEHRAALSTVMLISLDDEGQWAGQGSGAVIANSAVNPKAGNRIITDAHVLLVDSSKKLVPIDPTLPLSTAQTAAKRILVISPSTGYVIAEAKPIVLGTTDISENLTSDQAVIEISKFYQGGESVYRKIPGLNLARYQSPSGLVDAQLIGKVGLDSGASGGPAIDSYGKIIGMIEFSRDEEKVTISRPHLVNFEPVRHVERKGRDTIITEYQSYHFTGDPVTSKKIEMNGNNIPLMESVIDQPILDALGEAGKDITAKWLPKNEKGDCMACPWARA